ncbi:MAG: prephenate dehydrogenase/arogenate dehydrogenase family protein [Deltaproteobacteria bacterium]
MIFERVVIIGVGQIGASLAAAGRRSGALGRVCGVGRNPANLARAMELGLVDRVGSDLEEAVADADLVVVAAPVQASLDLLSRAAAASPRGCVLSDVGSVKGPVLEAAEAVGVGHRFVGAHPIAGGTGRGSAAADPLLFKDRTVVLTPGAATDGQAVERIVGLWEACGARVVKMTAADHDAGVALSSHLPQMAAFALCALAGSSGLDALTDLCGSGFRDTTRIADSDGQMWLEIASANRGELVAIMKEFELLWAEMTRAVEDADGEGLGEIIDRARSFRGRIGRGD